MRLLFILFLWSTLVSAGGMLEIEWPKLNPMEKTAQAKVAQSYPKVLTTGIEEVGLPVYLSSLYAYDKGMLIVTDKGFYSISFNLDGVMVLFEGDRTYQESVSATNPEFQKMMQKTQPVEFSISEEIMVAEFNRHGVNYAISVECEKPKTDQRCTEETFIRKLYDSLVLVGGKR